jgi:hypothetical protein
MHLAKRAVAADSRRIAAICGLHRYSQIVSKTRSSAATHVRDLYGAGWRLQLLIFVASCAILVGIVSDILLLVVVATGTLIASMLAALRRG